MSSCFYYILRYAISIPTLYPDTVGDSTKFLTVPFYDILILTQTRNSAGLALSCYYPQDYVHPTRSHVSAWLGVIKEIPECSTTAGRRAPYHGVLQPSV